MSEQRLPRVILSAVLALVAVAAVYYSLPPQVFKPQGLLLPTKDKRPATAADSVSLIYQMPSLAQSLGVVSVTRHFTDENDAVAQRQIYQKARSLAASVGANAILVTTFGHTPLGLVPANQMVWQLRGVALYVTNNGSVNEY